MFARFLVGVMLLLAPIAPGFWLISLAERSEEHHDVCQVEELAGRIARGRLVQPPPPATPPSARTTRQARRSRPRRASSHRYPAFSRRQRRGRRVSRCVLYGDDADPDPDPRRC